GRRDHEPGPAFSAGFFVGRRGQMAKTAKTTGKILRPATTAIHGGILRSQFGENSEAIFMTQSYVYDTAEAAAARFKGDDPGFIYARCANPTAAMFDERMPPLGAAGASRATA